MAAPAYQRLIIAPGSQPQSHIDVETRLSREIDNRPILRHITQINSFSLFLIFHILNTSFRDYFTEFDTMAENSVRPRTQAERQQERRGRLASRPLRNDPVPGPIRQKQYRARVRDRALRELQSGVNTEAEDRPNNTISTRHASAIYFHEEFELNGFGSPCDVCQRLWFRRDLANAKDSHFCILSPVFEDASSYFRICKTCERSLDRNKMPTISTSNGFEYPNKPDFLPPLNPVSSRLISPRLPFMSIRRLRRDGAYSILGQVINMPVDVDNMVNQLPRQLDDDYCINVNIKRQLIHKSSYLSDHVKKRELKVWLNYLVNQPLYKFHNIKIEWENFDRNCEQSVDEVDERLEEALVEEIDGSGNEVDHLIAQQHTVLWDECCTLDVAPAANSRPMNIIYNSFAEELSFPEIYLGVGRYFPPELNVTSYMIANSELRRADRRGAKPEHILYMAMKILRLRVVDCIYKTFRCVAPTEMVTRRMLEDRQYFEECVEHDFAFLKSIPNSAQYWQGKRKELFAMIRQLGKPSLFLTLSANEIGWPNLIRTLHGLNDELKHVPVVDPIKDLNRSQRCKLVSEDPVTCSAYFHKLVSVLMKMISSKQTHNPFEPHRVIDYFMRIEFQHRGSLHAHILLWLNDDPKEPISENMPRTVELIEKLLSVSPDDIGQDLYKNQRHEHTFTCTKRGESSCRIGIPYWPARSTWILLPMAGDDGRKDLLKQAEGQNTETGAGRKILCFDRLFLRRLQIGRGRLSSGDQINVESANNPL